MQADKDVVLVAVAQHGRALVHTTTALKADKEVVMAAVAENGYCALACVDSIALRADKEVLLAAVAQNGE